MNSFGKIVLLFDPFVLTFEIFVTIEFPNMNFMEESESDVALSHTVVSSRLDYHKKLGF